MAKHCISKEKIEKSSIDWLLTVVGEQKTQEVHAGLHTVIDLVLSDNPDDTQPDVSYINASPEAFGSLAQSLGKNAIFWQGGALSLLLNHNRAGLVKNLAKLHSLAGGGHYDVASGNSCS